MGKVLLDSAAGIEKWKSVVLLWGGAFAGLLLFGTPLADPVVSTWESTWQILPSWVVPAFLLASLAYLFVRGLVKSNYEEFQRVEGDKKELEDKLEEKEKRKAVKDLLGIAIEQGEDLRVLLRKEDGEWKVVGQQDVEDWVHRTHALIEAAFDKGEARRFLDSSDYTPEKPMPYREIRIDPYKYYLTPRLQRLNELIVRANTLEINPDFDSQSFTQSIEESTAERLRLEAAVERRNEENEKLEADNQRLVSERDAFESQSRQLRDELESSLRQRCIELTDDLYNFFEETRGEDSEGTVHLYRERFGGKVDPLRFQLKRHGLWKPREEIEGELEYPQNPDHLRSLCSYLRKIGVGVKF